MSDSHNHRASHATGSATLPSRFAWLGTIALLTATAQTICVAHISVHTPAEVQTAHAISSLPLLLGIAGTIALAWLTWIASHKWGRVTRWIGVNLCIALPIITALHMGPLPFAIHLEVVTYNLLAILSVIICVGVPIALLRREPQRWRSAWAPLLLSSVGATVLFGLHLSAAVAPTWTTTVPRTLLCGTLLATMVVLPLGTWIAREQQRVPTSICGAAITILVALRLSLSATPCALGSEIADMHTTTFGAALVATAMICAFALRPSLERWVRGLISVLTVVAVSLGWLTYSQGYGSYEDSLGALIASFLAFQLPYPGYVPEWKAVGALVGLFFGLSCIYANIVSTKDRNRGVALGLMVLAGLSFSSPHLILAFAAGASLLLVEPDLHELAPTVDDGYPADVGLLAPPDEPPAARSVEEVLLGLGERLDAPAVLIAEPFIAFEHTIDRVPVEIRHRADPGRWSFEIAIGHPGRSHPLLRLVPSKPRAEAPGEHPILRTHRLHGDARIFESETRFFDALTRFSGAHVEVWDAGFRVIADRHDAGLDEDGLEALLLAMVGWIRARPLRDQEP